MDHHMVTSCGSTLLYVWSLEKFLQRLQHMRDLHEEGQSTNNFPDIASRLKEQPHTDPWREISQDEIEMAIEVMQQNSRSTVVVDPDAPPSFVDSILKFARPRRFSQ